MHNSVRNVDDLKAQLWNLGDLYGRLLLSYMQLLASARKRRALAENSGMDELTSALEEAEELVRDIDNINGEIAGLKSQIARTLEIDPSELSTGAIREKLGLEDLELGAPDRTSRRASDSNDFAGVEPLLFGGGTPEGDRAYFNDRLNMLSDIVGKILSIIEDILAEEEAAEKTLEKALSSLKQESREAGLEQAALKAYSAFKNTRQKHASGLFPSGESRFTDSEG